MPDGINTSHIFVAIGVSGIFGLLVIGIVYVSAIIAPGLVSFQQPFSPFTGKEQHGNNYFLRTLDFHPLSF